CLTSESGPTVKRMERKSPPLAPLMISVAPSPKVRTPPSQYKKDLTTEIIDLYLTLEVVAE
ncbi:15779_t:CDS:1, partial [Racocetra persica]